MPLTLAPFLGGTYANTTRPTNHSILPPPHLTFTFIYPPARLFQTLSSSSIVPSAFLSIFTIVVPLRKQGRYRANIALHLLQQAARIPSGPIRIDCHCKHFLLRPRRRLTRWENRLTPLVEVTHHSTEHTNHLCELPNYQLRGRHQYVVSTKFRPSAKVSANPHFVSPRLQVLWYMHSVPASSGRPPRPSSLRSH